MKLSEFLLTCSGVSKGLLDKCPESEKIKHVSIGASVLFTALLATISSFFAFSLIFSDYIFVLPLAFFWGLIIFNLDRFVVATLRKRNNFAMELVQVSPRLFLSVSIALVIAKPLELQIFKSEIEQELKGQLAQRILTTEQHLFDRISILDVQKKEYNDELKSYFALKEQYYQEYICECDGTCGTGKIGRGSECLRKKEKYDAFLLEYKSKEQFIQNNIANLAQEKAALIRHTDEEKKEIKASFSFGLLARLQALHHLDSIAPWAITFMILFVEIAPIFTKLFSSKGPYDELLAIEENNFKFDYIKSLYQNESDFRKGYGNRLQEMNLIKKEFDSEKQKLVKDLYKDLGDTLTKQLKN